MNIKKLVDSDLLTLAKQKAQTERCLTLEIIELLQEVCSRRLHLQRGFSSLHEYCVKELRYSDGAAFRRIKAMRLLKDLPEVAKSIESGSLNLTTASQLQNAFETKAKNKEEVSSAEKLVLLNQVKDQSSRQVERVMADFAPELAQQMERSRPIGQKLVKIEFVVTEEMFGQIDKLKALRSHKNANFQELFVSLVQEELKRKDPKLLKERQIAQSIKTATFTRQQPSRIKNEATTSAPKLQAERPTQKTALRANFKNRYIPAHLRRQIWIRDKGQCTFKDPLTKSKCHSQHKLQIEHVHPYALGGEHDKENLRLLCQAHNQWMAIKQFGNEKMMAYLRNSLAGP